MTGPLGGVGGAGGVGGLNLSNLDVETALLAVQSQRTQLLDTQLADQIKAVQQRNDNIAALNNAMSAVSALQAKFNSDAKATDGIPNADNADVKQLIANANQALKDAGVSAQIDTKGNIDAAITNLKGLIDGQSNSQQMDMLRLQSLSNKRNEAFDVMTNFIKKMSDSRSSIIGNMR